MQALIQEHFIPAWQSIRQAPRVTLDLGEGHRIERTLRGNIAALIVTPGARVIDAWPGIYTPEAFVQALTQSLALWNQARALGEDQFESYVLAAHRSAHGPGGLAKLARLALPNDPSAIQARLRFVTPLRRAVLARTKARVERPLEVLLDREAVTNRAGDLASLDWLGARVHISGDAMDRLSPLEQDSIHHLSVKRPRVHAAFAELSNLPTSEELEHLLFDELGGIPMDDPWLGFGALVEAKPLDHAIPIQANADIAVPDETWLTSIDSGLARAKKLRRPICLIRTLGAPQSFPCLSSDTLRKTLSKHFVTVIETLRQSPMVHIKVDQDHQIARPLPGTLVTLVLASDGTVIDVIPGLGNDPRALAGALRLAIGQDRSARLEAFADRGDGLRWKIMTRAEKTRLALSKMAVEMPLIKAIGGQHRIPPGAPRALGDVYHLWPKARAIMTELNNEGFGDDLDKLTARVFLEALGWDVSDPMLGLEDTFAYDDARLASVARGALPPGSP